MTAEDAVGQLAEIVAKRPTADEDEIYKALAAAGIPDRLADRAYKFTQLAWGRVFLQGMGITFAEDYVCLDADGEIVETGRLSDEPQFVAALKLSQAYLRTPAFQRMALTSSDVQTVNSALNAGSKPENLVTAPPVLFLAVPTDAGLQKARQNIAQYFSSRPSRNSPPPKSPANKTKPWWKFWG